MVVFSYYSHAYPGTGALTVVSNDPLADQWSYRDVKVFDAWDQATGSRDVVVAVIDNGFDTFHPELAANVWRNILVKLPTTASMTITMGMRTMCGAGILWMRPTIRDLRFYIV